MALPFSPFLAPLPNGTPMTVGDSLSPAWFTWFGRMQRAVNELIAPSPVTFANLPSAPVEGQQRVVTDSSTATWGATIAGGGANRVLARWNGTNWTVAAI